MYRDHTAEREKAEELELMLDLQYPTQDFASSLEHAANKVDITL